MSKTFSDDGATVLRAIAVRRPSPSAKDLWATASFGPRKPRAER